MPDELPGLERNVGLPGFDSQAGDRVARDSSRRTI